MKYRKLGKKGPTVSSIGLGCMVLTESYGPSDKKLDAQLIQKAYEKGVTFFDTADCYGMGANEELVGQAIKPFRKDVLIATKCGIEIRESDFQHFINNKPSYIKKACHASLKRLGMETIDLYYLHRYNPETAIEESMGAMQELIDEGKILYVGLSEVDGDILERAYKVLGDKLVALQTEYSIANQAVAQAVLPVCHQLGIGFVAYSPLGRGLLSGTIRDPKAFKESAEFDFRSILPQFQPETYQENFRLVDALIAIARKKNCTPAQLALAWLLAQREDIIPIPGTKQIKYLEQNMQAVDITLSSADLAAIEEAVQKYPIKGARYPEELLKIFHLTS
jgi:aryl-alcohol dehydrogenase-like predicted oxidoreductase